MTDIHNLAEALLSITDSSAPDRDGRPSGIGGSTIGNDCDAFLSFTLRGFPQDPIDARVGRIFNLGQKIEDIAVADLKKVVRRSGWDFLPRDPETGQQFFVSMYGGHLRTWADGKFVQRGTGQGALFECKSMNAKNFAKLKKEGVATTQPKYFAQMQFMMHAMSIGHCVFWVYCKDDSQLYSEMVEYDEFYAESLMARVELAMAGVAHRKSSDPASFACRFCNLKGACHEGQTPMTSCRTCAHSVAKHDGTWWCNHRSEPAKEICRSWMKWSPK